MSKSAICTLSYHLPCFARLLCFVCSCLSAKTQNGTRDPRIYKNPRVTVSANMLVIRNLTLEDHMNIQCNASNNDGYVFADVYLNVMGKLYRVIFSLTQNFACSVTSVE